ncbi:hypothetical protein AVEN_134305-1, partial [Araneus ventricosus]
MFRYLQVAKCLIPSKWEGVYIECCFICLINVAPGYWGGTLRSPWSGFESSPSRPYLQTLNRM